MDVGDEAVNEPGLFGDDGLILRTLLCMALRADGNTGVLDGLSYGQRPWRRPTSMVSR